MTKRNTAGSRCLSLSLQVALFSLPGTPHFLRARRAGFGHVQRRSLRTLVEGVPLQRRRKLLVRPLVSERACCVAYSKGDRQTDRQTVSETDRQDRQTGREVDRETGRQAHSTSSDQQQAVESARQFLVRTQSFLPTEMKVIYYCTVYLGTKYAARKGRIGDLNEEPPVRPYPGSELPS